MTTGNTPMDKWKYIPWQKIERNVFKLQQRIYQASVKDDRKAVHKLQRLLMKSQSGRLLAVRRVSQDNQGKKTAGIDGVKSLLPKQRFVLSQTLKVEGKAQPVRRVWIPKPASAEKRPLGIPTIKDRATQALVKSALEPEWEARFEPNSYGFRPGRGCHDAIEAIFAAVRLQSKWVLDADIAKCFDRINHEALLNKLQTFPALRRQVRAWLRAGMMEQGELFPTEQGTPQGGCISPLLANIALHGMEDEIARHFPRWNNGERWVCTPPRVIRYADDFVVFHPSREVIEQCQKFVEQWLSPLGLELKSSKTRLVHTLEKQDGEAGFDFLGFNIQQHPVGNHRSGWSCAGKPLGFRTIIKPSTKSVKRHAQKMRRIIRAHRSSTQAALIEALNPLVCGWSRYFAIGSSRKTLSKLRQVLFQMLWGWAKRRHPNKGLHWVARKYWRVERNWRFQPSEHSRRLIGHDETHILNHIKVAGRRTPYDGDWVYWSTRMGRNPMTPKRVAWLLKSQKGRCQWCGLYFRSGDRMEVDHVQPLSEGGQDSTDNLQLLHRHCHDQKTAGTKVRITSARSFEEPYDGKLSSTVLKPSRDGDAPTQGNPP